MQLFELYILCIGHGGQQWTGFFKASSHKALAKVLKKRHIVEAYDITTEEVSRIL